MVLRVVIIDGGGGDEVTLVALMMLKVVEVVVVVLSSVILVILHCHIMARDGLDNGSKILIKENIWFVKKEKYEQKKKPRPNQC